MENITNCVFYDNFIFVCTIVQQSHTKKVMEQIKATKGEIEELADKLKRKVALHAKLVDEFEKNNRNINRLVLKSYDGLI